MDFYEQLGVPRTASADEIKKAYRAKARDHHPDMHAGEDEKKKHAELFKAAAAAFEILGDPDKKVRYDAQGYWGRRPSSPQPPRTKKSPVKTKEDFDREKKAEKQKETKVKSRFEKEPMDVNCLLYGGESSGRSIMMHVKLTPQEFKNGCKKSVTIKKRDFCQTCGGDGFGLFPCKKCGNNSIVKQTCGNCNCSGVVDGACPSCNGTGIGLWMLDEVVFSVSPKTQPGYSVMILGEGEMAHGKPPGNVRIVVL